jgi:hypothetical protein
MTAPLDPRQDPDRYRPEQDDLSIVPGLGEGRTAPLDLSKDPDRFDASAPPELPRNLDTRYDPDRFAPPGQGQSLTDLLGKEGAFEEKRDGYEWVFGLLAVLAFLALVSFLFNSVLSP